MRIFIILVLSSMLLLGACKRKEEPVTTVGDPNAPQVVIQDQNTGNSMAGATPVATSE